MIDPIQNGENMGSVRQKLNSAIDRANTAGLPVDTFADLPAGPVDAQSHFVRSLGYPIYWSQADGSWFNTLAAVVTAADE